MPRPFSVTFLALAVFCLAGFNLLGAVTGIRQFAFLSTLPLSVSPLYLIVSRGVWAIILATAGMGLWRLKHWGRTGTLAACTFYLAHGWFDRLFLQRADFARVAIPWALGLSAVSLALVWGILLQPKVKQSFSA